MDTSPSGPIDVVVLKFPDTRFRGEIGPALRDLVVRDLVRVIDLIFVAKEVDGSTTVIELAGLGPDLQPSFVGIAGQLEGGLLDADDADEVVPLLEPGSSAAVLAVENRWLVPFIEAVRRADGELVDQARVPSEVVDEVRAAGDGAMTAGSL
jgi:hypothetical protein